MALEYLEIHTESGNIKSFEDMASLNEGRGIGMNLEGLKEN